MLSSTFGRRPNSRASSSSAGHSDEAYDPNGPSLSPTESPRATISEVIENLGIGFAQIRVAVLAGPVSFADGAELLLISSVTTVVSKGWSFNAFQRGAVVSVVYVGIFIGNLVSGPVGDVLGRRLPILLSFFLIFTFSMLSAVSWGFLSLSFSRFVVGIAIGVGQPAQQTLVNEVTPTDWRVVLGSITQLAFSVGELYSGSLLLADDPQMVDLHWRALLIFNAIPSVIFGLLALAFLQQSPLYLACCGRYQESRVVLESMRRDNRAHAVSIDFKPHRVLCGGSGIPRQFRVVFGRELWVTSCIVMFSCFAWNLSYYGALYAFPQVMGEVEFGSSPAANLLLGAAVEIIGILLSVPCMLRLSRKLVMRVYLILTALGLFAFALGCSGVGGGLVAQGLLLFGYYGEKFTCTLGVLVFYLYASEVYPTMARTTGTALCFAAGRVASMLSPLLYELMVEVFQRPELFFQFIAAINVVNLAIVSFLPFETFGKPLRDDVPEAKAAGYGAVLEVSLDVAGTGA